MGINKITDLEFSYITLNNSMCEFFFEVEVLVEIYSQSKQQIEQ